MPAGNSGTTMRIGIIGTGRIAAPRARLCADMEGVEIAWVCSREKSRAEEFIHSIGDSAAALDDWERAVRATDVDAVYVAAPNALHFPMADAALSAGRHVLLEHPPAMTAEDGWTLLELAAREKKVLHAGLTYRYGGMPAALKRILWDPQDPFGVGSPHAYVYLDSDGGPISRWLHRDELTGGTYISSMYDHFDEAIALFGRVGGHSGPRPALEIERSFVCERGHVRVMRGEITVS